MSVAGGGKLVFSVRMLAEERRDFVAVKIDMEKTKTEVLIWNGVLPPSNTTGLTLAGTLVILSLGSSDMEFRLELTTTLSK